MGECVCLIMFTWVRVNMYAGESRGSGMRVGGLLHAGQPGCMFLCVLLMHVPAHV